MPTNGLIDICLQKQNNKKFKMNNKSISRDKILILFSKNIAIVILLGIAISANSQPTKIRKQKNHTFQIPKEYLREADTIPAFWISSYDDVNQFLKKTVAKGKLEVIGKSAGGRPIYAVFYGQPRQGKGTSTFSGALGFGNVGVYRGTDHKKTVYMGLTGMHGGEFEGIVGNINLISVIETGKDLRGKEWPLITAAIAKIDRLILIPIMNPDGRERIPLRMEPYRDANGNVHEYLNTGGNAEGEPTGWPLTKEFIPLDFSKPGFPGGYPNDAGVNLQHDNFIGNPQPETKILFELTEREKPDLILNMHTGSTYISVLSSYMEASLKPAFDTFYNYVNTGLTLNGLKKTNDLQKEAVSKSVPGSMGCYLDGLLNLHCGALSVVIESPSHGFNWPDEAGKINYFSPDRLIDGQLICHQEAMRFLVESGGRAAWTPEKKRK